jgi:hypothetical protein
MPITPDEAALLTHEEETLLSELDATLSGIIQRMYHPNKPDWSITIPGPEEGFFDLDIPDELELSDEEFERPQEFLADRIAYLKALLVSRFEEKGWVLIFKDDEKALVVTRKSNA